MEFFRSGLVGTPSYTPRWGACSQIRSLCSRHTQSIESNSFTQIGTCSLLKRPRPNFRMRGPKPNLSHTLAWHICERGLNSYLIFSLLKATWTPIRGNVMKMNTGCSYPGDRLM
jgi:hypothetical protein